MSQTNSTTIDQPDSQSSSNLMVPLVVILSFFTILAVYFICSARKWRYRFCVKRDSDTEIDIVRKMSQQTLEDTCMKYERQIKGLRIEKEQLLEERNKFSSLVSEKITEDIKNIKIEMEKGQGSEEQGLKLKELLELKERIIEADHHRICTICYQRPREIAFLDCGHYICCEECSLNVTNCPYDKSLILCRKKIFV